MAPTIVSWAASLEEAGSLVGTLAGGYGEENIYRGTITRVKTCLSLSSAVLIPSCVQLHQIFLHQQNNTIVPPAQAEGEDAEAYWHSSLSQIFCKYLRNTRIRLLMLSLRLATDKTKYCLLSFYCIQSFVYHDVGWRGRGSWILLYCTFYCHTTLPSVIWRYKKESHSHIPRHSDIFSCFLELK